MNPAPALGRFPTLSLATDYLVYPDSSLYVSAAYAQTSSYWYNPPREESSINTTKRDKALQRKMNSRKI